MVNWEKVYAPEKQLRPVTRPDAKKPVRLVKTQDGLKRECDPSRSS